MTIGLRWGEGPRWTNHIGHSTLGLPEVNDLCSFIRSLHYANYTSRVPLPRAYSVLLQIVTGCVQFYLSAISLTSLLGHAHRDRWIRDESEIKETLWLKIRRNLLFKK